MKGNSGTKASVRSAGYGGSVWPDLGGELDLMTLSTVMVTL